MTKDDVGCLVAIIAWGGIFWAIGIPILKGIARRKHSKDRFEYLLGLAEFDAELAWLQLQTEGA